jgi:hypothetical protein
MDAPRRASRVSTTLPVLLGLDVYELCLQVPAIKAVHRCGWGEAAAPLLLPGILLAMLCGFLFLVLVRLGGPSINEIVQQMQGLQ